MSLTPSRLLELVRELSGTKCRCGRPKQTNKTFCGQCYYKLPEKMRMALYRRLGHGYEEAYDDAVEYLKDEQ